MQIILRFSFCTAFSFFISDSSSFKEDICLKAEVLIAAAAITATIAMTIDVISNIFDGPLVAYFGSNLRSAGPSVLCTVSTVCLEIILQV